MKFPFEVLFKIAAQQILQQHLMPQQAEPADEAGERTGNPTVQPHLTTSALSLLGKDERATTSEPAPKVVTTTGLRG